MSMYLVTDGLRSYEPTIKKDIELQLTAHDKTRSLKDGFVNRAIERYHNEIREKLKNRRGLGNDKSTQRFAELYQIHHNFVRPHTGLPDNMTPAEAAGIVLKLGHDKYRDLINKSTRLENFVNDLGKRVQLVEIINEKDCI